jgi:hypothetical protein
LYNNLKKKIIENDEFQEIVKSEYLTPEDLNSAVDEELNCLREKQMAKHELDNLSAETNISPNNENPASGCIENSDDQGELKLE